MKIGLVGLPGSGKSTVFRALTGRPVGGAAGQIAVVEVPDPRTLRIAEIYHSEKISQPEVTFLDLGALHQGDSQSGGELELAKLARDVDALAAVVQCFGELDHRGEPLDPAADLETVLLEMSLADLGQLEARQQRAAGAGSRREAHVKWELDLLEHCRAHVAAGGAACDLELPPDAVKHLRGFALLTMKPVLVVANVAEGEQQGAAVAGVRACCAERGLPQVALCAELEEEIAQLPAAEQAGFLADFGLSEAGREALIHAAYGLLDIITFLTGGPKEAHAWTISAGATAAEAAGTIHTDMQKGFIRAEVVPFPALDELGSEKACREKGLLRIEGRDYVVADGDVIYVRFSR